MRTLFNGDPFTFTKLQLPMRFKSTKHFQNGYANFVL